MCDFIASLGASAVYDLCKTTLFSCVRHVNRLYHYATYKRHVKILIEQLDVLEKCREQVKTMVASAEVKGDEIHHDVTVWLNDTLDALSKNRAKAERAGQRFCEFVFHSKAVIDEDTLSTIGAGINGMIKRYVEFNGRVSYPSRYFDKDYMAFEVRRQILERVMDALRDCDVEMIGLHGMGGIGKTTLAKEIARQAKKEANLFDKVIMCGAVSQTPDYATIQLEIANSLSLRFESNDEASTKADKLRQELSKQMKVLIILDDIWEQINLFDIGIHFADAQKGCKILFTSRRQGLYNGRKVVDLPLKPLKDDESEKLFRQVVGGETLDNNPDCEPLVSKLVKECGGVPIVINVVASALKDAPSYTWKAFLRDMSNSVSENIEGMECKVIQSIKLSYDHLKSDETKSLLLLCSTFREDELISDDDLLMYCVGWGFLKNVNKLEDARDKLRTLIDILRKNSLLLPSDESISHIRYHWVKLHDVIRDVLKSIALKEGYFSLRKDEKLREENLKDLLAMSLEYDANELPNKLPCPNLVFLHTLVPFSRPSRKCLSDCFLEETKNLRVLKLQFVDLRSPPSSFSCLVGSLETLCLNVCDLQDTAFLGSFKKLKCLDLSYSTFKKLSKEVGQLTRLQLLKLDDCYELQVIEPDVISSLINLEEFYMRNVHQVHQVWDNVSLTELKKLPRLNTLCIKIANGNLLSKDLFTCKMKRYDIIVGRILHFWRLNRTRYSRVLQLKIDKADVMNECGIDKLISDCQKLVLSDCKVRYLVNSALMECNHRVFQNLEIMELVELRNLQKICEGEFAADSFRKLEVVEVSQCHSLKNILPVSNIGQLQKIKVEKCDMMEEIVFHRREDGTHQKIEFMKLQKLGLHHLPNLVQFCKVECEHNIPSSSSLETLPSTELPFFMEEVSFPNLEELYLESLEKVQMIWPDKVREVFYMQNLKKLAIKNCPTVKYLFPFALARSLVQLTTLSIMSCDNMEEILVIKGVGEEGSRTETILFPKLERIELDSLSNLKSFSAGKDLAMGYPSLKSLEFRKCPKLTSFHKSCTNEQVKEPFFNEKVSFASMENLELSDCAVHMIWPNQLEKVSYIQNLKIIKLWNCGNLEYICSLAMARSLVQLKELHVESCETIQEVFATKEGEEEGSLNETILFPKLEILRLYSLSNLKSFSGGKCLAIQYPSLKLLTIEKCRRLKTFHRNCTSSEFEKAQEPLFNEKVSFPNSEELYFSSRKEKEIGLNEDPKILTIYMKDCPAVKHLFDFALARSLVQLRKLSICYFENMEEILVIKEAGEEGSRKKTILFPKLEKIILESLSNLKSFSGGGKYLAMECPSLKSLTISQCPRLKTFHKSCTNEFEQVEEPFFNEKVSFASMKELDLRDCDSVQMIWLNQLEGVSYMQNLKKIYLRNFGNLEYICSLAMARSLVQLKELYVESCETLQEVFVTKEAEEERSLNETILFSKLEILEFRYLSNLTSFSSGKYFAIECPSMNSLRIIDCPRLKAFHRSCTNSEFEKAEEPLFNEKIGSYVAYNANWGIEDRRSSVCEDTES